MGAQLPTIKDQVQEILTSNFNNVQLTQSGSYSMRNGSTRIFVRVVERSEDFTTIHLTVPVVIGAKPSPELNEYIAYHADDFIFGHLSLTTDEGDASVWLTHTLLGNYLDEEELRHGVLALATSGDKLDDDLKSRFGGRRFHED